MVKVEMKTLTRQIDVSVNSSNSSDSSLFLPICFGSRTTIFILMSFLIANIFLLPLFFFILNLGVRRWRDQRRSSAAASVSHSDFFTYNVIVLELISLVGAGLYCFGAYTDAQILQQVGGSICNMTSPGQTLLHLLTCVERYLAVVHPITYRSLRHAGGVRIRNIITGCVWLLCIGLMGLNEFLNDIVLSVTNSCLLFFSLFILSFCSFSVLRVLNQSGPGEVSGDRERVDQSKQRAFHTIVAIMVALSLRFMGLLLKYFMFSPVWWTQTHCVVGWSAVWLTLPSSLVLPLLFLHKAGNLAGCKHTPDSGRGSD